MTDLRLGCGHAETLFYEPDGLLLQSCLIPTDNRHSMHLLTFALSYLGPGEITVHVALSGGHDDDTTEPVNGPVLLRGVGAPDDAVVVTREQPPNAWLTYAAVPDTRVVGYRYAVGGHPGDGEDDMRGELVTEVSGLVPLLTATTRDSATRRPLSGSMRSGLGRGTLRDGPGGFPLPEWTRHTVRANWSGW